MLNYIIMWFLYICSGLFLFGAIIILLRKREGDFKKAVIALVISVLEIIIGIYIQRGMDMVTQNGQELMDSQQSVETLESDSQITEEYGPNFQLEYWKDDEYKYLLSTTRTIEYNDENQEEKIIDENQKVEASIGVHYRLCNLEPNTVTEVSMQIFDYIVIKAGDRVLVTIPVTNLYQLKGSYSYSNDYYEFERKPFFVDYLIETLNETLQKEGIGYTSYHSVKLYLEYTDKKGCKREEIWTLVDESDEPLSVLKEYMTKTYIVDASELTFTEENNNLEIILKNIKQVCEETTLYE